MNNTVTQLPQVAASPALQMQSQLDQINAAKVLGEVLAECDFFGVAAKDDTPQKVLAKSQIVAHICAQEGISLMAFRNKYHFVDGKLDMRADAMLAEFQKLGGTFTIEQSDSEAAIATFSFRGTTYREAIVWKELCANPEPPFFRFNRNTGKLEVATNYEHPRKRSQMLWARCVSNAIRKVCPMVNSGVYTPEETAEFDAPEIPAVVEAAPVRKAAKKTAKAIPAATIQVAPTAPAPEVVEAEVVEAKPAPESPAPAAIPLPTPDDALAHCPNQPELYGPYAGKLWDEIDAPTLSNMFTYIQANRASYPDFTDAQLDYLEAVVRDKEGVK